MTLDRQFAELYIVEGLMPMFDEDGFEWLEGLHQFRLHLAEGFQNVILAISPYDDAVLIEFHLGIRWDAIEQLVGQTTRALPDFRPNDHTLVISQGKLLGLKYFRHQAKNTDDLDQIIAHFRAFWQKQWRIFLVNYFTIDQIHICLNGAPRKPCMFLPNQAHRYLRGIVAAKLADFADFQQLVDLYALGLAREPQGGILMGDYRALVSQLQKI